MMLPLSSAALAFDAIAPDFDVRFGAWASVAAQRRAVRAALLRQFPAAGRILELGGGTGEDAAYLARLGFKVHLTDPSPAMVSVADSKLAALGSRAQVVAAEEMNMFADAYLARGGQPFDGAFSNFAPLNCVLDLTPAARGLARLLRPGALAMLVLFGTFCPGEMAAEILRGRPRSVLRRFQRKRILARLAGLTFDIVYHRCAAIQRAFSPWFRAGETTWDWHRRPAQRC